MNKQSFNIYYFSNNKWYIWIQTSSNPKKKKSLNKPRVYNSREAAVNACNLLLKGDDLYDPVDAVAIKEIKQ